MLGFLGRFRKKKESNYDDIRSHILGEQKPLFNEPASIADEEPLYNEPSFNKQPLGIERPFETEREPISTERNSYEIIDRLNFIENQLSAIKSQVELVNERLKNMEMKLVPRRY